MYLATQEDLQIILQKKQTIKIKIVVLDDKFRNIGNAEGNIINFNMTIDSQSDIRRVASLSLKVTRYNNINPDSDIWIDKYANLYIALYDEKNGRYKYYNNGRFVINSYSFTINNTETNLTIQLLDLMSLFTEERGNQITTPISIPVAVSIYPCPSCHSEMICTQNSNSDIVEQNGIKTPVITTKYSYHCNNCGYEILNQDFDYMPSHSVQYANITNALKEVVNTYSILPENKYNICNLKSNFSDVPYDLTYDIGTYPIQIINDLKNLYPNFQAYYDENGVFTFNEIPCTDEDIVILDESFMDKVIISENKNAKFGDICNIHDVWGRKIEADRTVTQCLINNASGVINYHCYIPSLPVTINIKNTTSVSINDGVEISKLVPLTEAGKRYLFTPTQDNTNNSHLFFIDKDFDNDELRALFPNKRISTRYVGYPIYKELPEGKFVPVEAGELKANKPYIVWLKPLINNSNELYGFQCVLEGEPQIRAVVVDYSKEHLAPSEFLPFMNYFGTNNVFFKEDKDNPFTADKIGKKIKSCSGGEFENIYSLELAKERGNYENYKSTRLLHNVTITTLLIPWIEVNQLIKYTSPSTKEVKKYLINKIDADYNNGTMTLDLSEFYPYYPTLDISQNSNYNSGGLIFDGNQYIDLDYKPTNNTKIEIIFSPNSYPCFVFGCRTRTENMDAFGFCIYENQIYPQFGSFQSSIRYSLLPNSTHNLVLSQEGLYIDNHLIMSYENMNFSSDINIYLGTRNSNSSIDNRMYSGTIYCTNIYENGTMVKSLTPYIQNNINGLYDIINKSFYPQINLSSINNVSFLPYEQIVLEEMDSYNTNDR